MNVEIKLTKCGGGQSAVTTNDAAATGDNSSVHAIPNKHHVRHFSTNLHLLIIDAGFDIDYGSWRSPVTHSAKCSHGTVV